MRSLRVLIPFFLLTVHTFGQDLLKEAQTLRDQHRFYESAQKLKQYCDKNPKAGNIKEVKLELADTYLSAGLLLEAQNTLERYLTSYPSDPKEAEIKLKLARCYESRGQYMKAITTLKAFAERFSGDRRAWEARKRAAELYLIYAQKPEQTLRDFQILLVRFPNDPRNSQVYYKMAHIYLQQRKTKQAIETLKLVVQKYPKSVQALPAQKDIAWLTEEGGLKDWAGAIKEYLDYLAMKPSKEETAHALERVARIFRDRLNKPLDAVDYYNKLLQLEQSPSLYWERLSAIERAGDPSKLISALNEFIQKFPASPRLHTARRKLAETLWRSGKKQEAVNTLLSALKRYPNPDDYYLVGQYQKELKQWDLAVLTFKRLIAEYPGWNGGEPFLRTAECLIAKGDLTGAEKFLLESALSYAFHSDIAIKSLWALAEKLYTTQKNYQKAGEAYARILRDYPGADPWTRPSYAPARIIACAKELKNIDVARNLIEAVAEQNKFHHYYRKALAEVVKAYLDADQPQKAIELGTRVVAELQNDIGALYAYLYLGDAYGKLGNRRKQLECYAELARFRADSAFSEAHSLIDQRRKGVLSQTVRQLTTSTTELKTWFFKKDPENVGDKEGWFKGETDNTWTTYTAGKDWGNYDGVGWLVTTTPVSKTPGQYTINFSLVDDEATVYVDSSPVGRGSKSFSLTFTTPKKEGKITIAVRVVDKGALGGFLKPVTITKPSTPSGETLAELALAYLALGKVQDSAERLNKYFDSETDKAKADRLRPYQHDIYLLTGNTERLLATKVDSPRYYLTLARAFARAGREADVLKTYQEGTTKFPRSVALAYALARYHESKRSWKSAVDQYLKLLSLSPQAPYAPSIQRYTVWLCYDSSKWRNVSRAREVAEQFVESEPLYWHRLLGDLYYDRDPRDYNRAFQHYQSYATLSGADSWHASSRIYSCLMNLKQYPIARKFAQDWLKKNANHPYVPYMLYNLAEATRHIGPQTAKEALSLFQQLQQKYPNHPATRSAVYTAVSAFDPAVALTMLESWEKGNPTDGANIAPMYWSLGQRIESTKDGAVRAEKIYRHIWQNYRWKWAENIYCADRLAQLLQKQWRFDELLALDKEIVNHFRFHGEGRVISAWWRIRSALDPYLARRATPDSSMNGYYPSKAVDGNTYQRGTDPNYTWMSAETGKNHWLDIEIPKPELINYVEVVWADPQNLPQSVKLQYWDGQKYIDITPFHKITESRTKYYFEPVRSTKIRVLQQAQKGPATNPNVMLVSEVILRRHLTDQQWNALFDHLTRMREGYRGRYEQWGAGSSYCSYLQMKGEYLRADVEMQRLLYSLPRNNSWLWDRAVETASTKIDQKRYGEAGAILGTLLSINPRIDKKRRSRAEQMLATTLYESGAVAAIIDPKAEEAPLLWGDIFLKAGEPDIAWQKYLDNRDIFPKHDYKLSPTYIKLIVSRLIAIRETTEARGICRRFLMKREKDPHVPASDKAGIRLLLGDSYYADENYDLAREEYQTVVLNYKKTPQAVDAKFKISQCLMSQKIYGKAEELLKSLVREKDQEVVTRAHLMLGVLFLDMGEKDMAKEQFQKVLALFPPGEIADQAIWWQGFLYKQEGLYQEALRTFRLMGALRAEAPKTVSPGDAFRIKLMDRYLSTIGAQQYIPIVVLTTHGDKEILYLEKSPVGAGLFISEMDVKLGDPIPDNRVIEVTGDDVLTYDYHPDFAKDKDVKPIPKEYAVTIASDAELKVSATEIKDEEEEEAPAFADLFGRRPKRYGSRLFRKENEFKPGNPIYVQVIDFDRDLTGDPDTVEITSRGSSGDTVTLRLKETEPHSGKFRGAIQTGQRPPDANASDYNEGNPPILAIDKDRSAKSAWIASLDYRVPKWFSIDLKEPYTISKIEWDRGEGFDPKEDRAILNYSIEVSADNKTWFPIATYPEGKLPLRGAKPIWDPDATSRWSGAQNILHRTTIARRGWVGKNNQKDYIIDIDLGRTIELEKIILRKRNNNFAFKQYEIYTEKELGSYPGPERTFDGWKKLYISTVFPKPKDDEVDLTKSEKGAPLARYIRLRILSHFGTHPEIAQFQIFPVLKGKIEPYKDGKIGAIITFPAVKARHIRMTINSYHTDAPAIAYFAVYDERGKLLVPSGIDILQLATNKILEISPGDTVTVTYVDRKNIINDNKPRTLEASMEATYYNGSIVAITRKWIEDDYGNRRAINYLLKRIEPGDTIIAQITEYDADITDDIDKISFTVVTSSGAKLELEAEEIDPYSGVFTKEIRTYAEEEPDTLLVKPGDVIELSYIDEFNTDPGNRIARKYVVYLVQPSDARVRVARSISTIENPDGSRMNLISLEEKLAVEVFDRDRAKHSGETVKVKLRTTSGAEQTLECKIQTGAYYRYISPEKVIQDLDTGRFYGEIRVVLGSKDAPTEIPIAAALSEFATEREEETLPTEPVLNVTGTDIITVAYEDEFNSSGKSIEKVDFARLVSDATLGFYDDEYENPVTGVYVGDNLYIKVEDSDSDSSDAQDTIQVTLTATKNDKVIEKEVLTLSETLPHSGVFTVSALLELSTQPTPSNGKVEVDFGVGLTLSYTDEHNTKSAEPVQVTATAEVVAGTDGSLMAFSKKYPEEKLAVETQYRIGECFYFLGREHLKNKITRLALLELSTGAEILRELIIRYPKNPMIAEITYLLGNITMERREYDEAIRVFRTVTREYEKSPVAPEAQYKLAMSYEKKGDFDKAAEEYVRLAYKYPDSPLIGDAMIRIGLYYFDKKDYETATSVFSRFVERYPEDPKVERVAFKIGLCYMLQEKYADAGEFFKKFVEEHPSSQFAAAALYWSGEGFLKANMVRESYQMFKRCIWDHTASKWAKYARGRLTSPIFDRIKDEE